MKKFILLFFLLIILACLGFFFGWAQLPVPPDSYGVIRSKTHGIDPLLVKPGELRWVWYKLIPTNAETLVFRLNPVHHAFSASYSLPSGEIYSIFAGLTNDFSWEINAAFSFFLKPDALIQLVTDINIADQEELVQYEKEIAQQIEVYILRFLKTNEGDRLEELLKTEESPALAQEILDKFPYIEKFSIKVQSVKLPDFAMYYQIKNLYDSFIAIQETSLFADIEERTKNRVQSYEKFYELEQYGALLAKYPLLLDYLIHESKDE
ncbi:MAG: hypothetical protein FWH41_10655 [Treponema sp.]|nr:hypothetical protein [Treponema sp.]